MRTRVREIGACVVARSLRLDGWSAQAARYIDPGKYEFVDDGTRNVDVNDIWARTGQTVFLRRDVTVPVDWAGLKVGIELLTGGEGLLSVNGTPHHGIDDNRGYILLTPAAVGGETYRLELEMRTGGHDDFTFGDMTRSFILRTARLVGVEPRIERAWYDFRVAWETASAYPEGSLLHETILLEMRRALHPVDMRDHEAPGFPDALLEAAAALRTALDACIVGDNAGKICFTGHSHIDVAWLWPIRETVRKVGRTYSTVTALMDEFPDYHFNCSQAPLFLFLKEQFPDVYARVRQRVKEGRFEPVGGTWIEHDTNVPSGEALVRQCLYGQRFFRSELGCDVRVGWLPDVFGYTWALPQIYRKAGIEYFMTAKVGWNENNRLPYNTFWWQGIDGTRILAHLVHNRPNMYGAMVGPAEMMRVWADYRPALLCPDVLSPFGFGDGGGGPTRQMLEFMPRLANMPGVPRARCGRVHEFFDGIAKTGDSLPVWNNEMYFERHRGTTTSQAWTKRWNRKSELLYRDAEMLCSAGTLLGLPYPKQRIVDGWHTILLNQFHDILPGSSVQIVYEDSARDYAAVLATGEEVRGGALAGLAAGVDTSGEGEPVVVANTLSWDRTASVTVVRPEGAAPVRVLDAAGCEVASQAVAGGVCFVAEDVPSCGYATFRLVPAGDGEPASPFAVDGERIVTPYWEITFGADGTLHRVYDRVARREALPEGARAAHLQVFEDKPSGDEAWDIDRWYIEKMWEFVPDAPAVVTECGSVRLVLTQTLRYGKSTIERDMVLYAHTPRIEFVNRVDWQERKTLLKVAFPVDVHATRATYEIAFGAIERPTHASTSWDEAQFEVPGHRWADLSEAGYGVSVLNDCKYGWDTRGNVIRLTLLRSPESPDPDCDRGQHEFTYALLPHAGDWRGGTVRAGLDLNVPMLVVAAEPHAGALPAAGSFAAVDRDHVIIDTVKQAEDSDAWIVRLYEAHGARGPVALTFDRPVAAAYDCDLLEESDTPLEVRGAAVELAMLPYEIRTVKVLF